MTTKEIGCGKIKDGKLVSSFPTGNKAWLAKITSLHEKYEFDRDFLNGTRQGSKRHAVQAGEYIEHVRYSHSGKNRTSKYYKVVENGGGLEFEDLTKNELKEEIESSDEVEQMRKKVLSRIDSASESEIRKIAEILEVK